MADPIKVFANADDMATFQCLKCGKSKTADVSRYKKTEKSVLVKCSCPCGHTYTVLLERRKNFRKNVAFPGTYTSKTGDQKGEMIVTDLSRSGVRVKLNSETGVQVGDTLIIEFNLDDTNRSFISREVVVRSIHDQLLGTEFLSTDHYDRLGSYLLYSFD